MWLGMELESEDTHINNLESNERTLTSLPCNVVSARKGRVQSTTGTSRKPAQHGSGAQARVLRENDLGRTQGGGTRSRGRRIV